MRLLQSCTKSLNQNANASCHEIVFQLSSAKFQPFCSVPSKPIADKLAALGFQQINIAGRNVLIVRLRDFFAVKSIVDLSLKQRTKISFQCVVT